MQCITLRKTKVLVTGPASKASTLKSQRDG